ncbi:MAG: cytochrome b N-terminal domain-containing protein [Thermaerobacter sp.]|nr:cytochrome b N-terminal domain-containing protein [Thermaerobacter sp.]
MNWTKRAQETLRRELPYEDLLPAELPAYVHSYVYYFGVATLASFVVLVASGVVLVSFGPQWWHVSGIGHFFNSLHFWTVQIFFFAMVLHLWAQFFMAAWRDGRQWTWVIGVLLFLISVPTALTGFLSQQNFDSQWIAVQGKDAMNALGVGGFFNLLNFGQMYSFHIVILPLVLGILIGLHVLMVRWHGVVRPIDDPPQPGKGGRRK